MAHLYRVGQGVPRDLGLAYKWHVISEATCHDLPEDLLAARREVGALLGPEQLRNAEHAASLWLESFHRGGLTDGRQSLRELQQLEDPRRTKRHQGTEEHELLPAS